jgi:hypothetical protein
VGTCCAADAVGDVDVGMLSLWAVRTQLPLFRSLAGFRLNFLVLLEFEKHEKQENDRGNDEGKSVVHKVSAR